MTSHLRIEKARRNFFDWSETKKGMGSEATLGRSKFDWEARDVFLILE
jgi:hypothetical protein